MPQYDAFISYSHAKDKAIAARLQSVVQRLGKPWYARRHRLLGDPASVALDRTGVPYFAAFANFASSVTSSAPKWRASHK